MGIVLTSKQPFKIYEGLTLHVRGFAYACRSLKKKVTYPPPSFGFQQMTLILLVRMSFFGIFGQYQENLSMSRL